jgi:vacuolar-type H+-ATPase subunit E/Vma4
LSLRELQTEIESKAEEEASRILETAKQEAQKIVAEASARAASLTEERTKALVRELDAQERAELAIARMDRKGELLRVRSGWAERVFEEVEKRIAEMAENGGRKYHELLRNLVLEGITQMNGDKFIVETNSRDKDAISDALRTIAERAGKIKNGKVVLQIGTLQTRTSGGVVVSTEDRVQYFNNTLEARLSAASRNLEGTVRRMLSGGGETNE